MALDDQIRERISLYLNGRGEAADLESWLSEITWGIDEEPPATRHIAYAALRLLSEAANGDWSDDQLNDQLRALLKIPPPGGDSVLPSVETRDEGLLGKLSLAQQEAESMQVALDDDAAALALVGYAYFSTQTRRWSGSERPSGPAFLRQPKGETDTPVPAAEELAIS
jgi:hypothetical protein